MRSLDLKARGPTEPAKLATGDGSLGFWLAMGKFFPSTGQQRCWVHKTANVLDKLPKNQQAAAKADLHEIWMSATKEDAIKAFDRSHRDLRRQVAQGDGVPGKRPGGTAGVLRLPRRALGTSANQQSDRKHIRDGTTAIPRQA